MSDAKFVESLVTELNKAVGGGKTALAEVNALKPRVAALEGARPNATVVQTWKSGNNWCRVWSNGFVEQGGFFKFPSVGTKTITLLRAYSNTGYTLVTSAWCNNSVNSATNGCYVGTAFSLAAVIFSKTGSSFGIGSRTTTEPVGICWYACGY